MRFLIASSCLFLALLAPSPAQEPSPSINLTDFARALQGYSDDKLVHKSPKSATSPTPIATQDPTLLRFVNIRTTTLSILRDIDDYFTMQEKAEAEIAALGKKITPETYQPNRNPKKPPISMQLESKIMEIRSSIINRGITLKSTIKTRLDTLTQLASTPVGQQFSMPESSPLLKALQKEDPLAAMRADSRQGIYERSIEVASSTPDGFIGYQQKRVSLGGQETLVTDRSTPIFIRGYTKPLTLGESLRIKIKKGEQTTINGISLQGYTYIE